jgi:CDP-glycerol glycerophosphotransferase (TagB/SpsB family)
MLDKLFKKIIYYFSGLVKRDPLKWLFASHTNFGDNSRYFFQDEYNPDNVRKIWIAKNKNEYRLVKNLGYECYLKGSIKAKFHALTSQKYIYSCYVSDIGYQYSKGAICINLWHGIPLKKIEFDIKTGPLAKKFNQSKKSKLKHPEIYRKHDYVLCPSNYVFEYSFKNAFQISENQRLSFTYPRSIFLKQMQKKSKKFEYLYVPTWRDHQNDFLQQSNLDLGLINEFCIEHDCIFKIKFHPNTKINFDEKLFSNIVFVDPKDDPNQHLIDADCLITDYSSIFFDFLVLDRPIIFYVFDEEIYQLKSREMYPNANDIVCGEKVYNFSDLLGSILRLKNGQDQFVLERKHTIEKFSLDFRDLDNRGLYRYLRLL